MQGAVEIQKGISQGEQTVPQLQADNQPSPCLAAGKLSRNSIPPSASSGPSNSMQFCCHGVLKGDTKPCCQAPHCMVEPISTPPCPHLVHFLHLHFIGVCCLGPLTLDVLLNVLTDG